MGLRMNLTKTTLEFDGWDIDMMIDAVDERLNEIAESVEMFDNHFPMEDLWGWYWHLASNLHDGKRAIEEEIANRDS